MKFTNKNRVIGILLSIALVVAIILSLLPMGIRLGATYWLEQHGVQRVEIENVDLNLFSGVFALEGFSADDGLKVGRLAADIDWWPMKEHRIFFRSIEVKGFEVAAHQNEVGVWQVSSIKLDEPTPESSEPEEVEEPGEPWQVVLNGIEIDDVKVKVKGAQGQQPFDAALALKSLNIDLTKAEADGALWLKNSLKLGQITFNGLGYAVKNGGLTLNSTLFLPALGSDMAAGFKINGMNLKLNDFSMLDSRNSVRLVHLDSAEMKQLNIAGTSKANFDLLSLQGVALPAAGDNTLGRVGQINLEGGDFDSAGTVTLKKVAVNDLQAAIKKLKTGKMLVLDQLQVATRQDKAAKVADVKDAKDKETAEPTAADAGKKPVILVDEFSIAKGSSIAYRDESLFPPFDTKIEVERFTLAPVDPSGKQSGVLDVLLNLDRNGSLAINGDLNLNPDDLRSEMKIVLKNFDMPKLTGFVEGDFGQAIKTGQFNMDSDIKFARNKLDAKNKLLIRRLVLKKAKQPGKAEQKIGMPVDMALDMLRDDRGDITIEVPVSGALDDPNININDVINQALMSSISGSAMTYAKILLQPYGAIMMAAEYAVGAAQDAAKPKLTPIVFEQRSAQLGADMADYAGKIATLLVKTKAFRLQICGVAMRSEGEPFEMKPDESGKKMRRVERYPMGEEQLLNLGEERSNAVRQAIQAKGVAAERLFSCRAEIDETAKKAKPRVELILD